MSNQASESLRFEASFRKDDDTGGYTVKFNANSFPVAVQYAKEKAKDYPDAGLEFVQQLAANGQIVAHEYFNTI